MISSALGGYSRLAEIEAWTVGDKPASSLMNFAQDVNGGRAVASSTYNATFPAASVNNGERAGVGWAAYVGGWADSTNNVFEDWLQVTFPFARTIQQVDVFTVQDSYSTPSQPTAAMTFSTYGITQYRVQYWTGSSWTDVGSTASNNKVWKTFTFSPVSTTAIRVLIEAGNGYSRLTEVEAWGAPQALMLSNSAKVPVLLYHSHQVNHAACTDELQNSHVALKLDLERIYANGFTVVPAYWIAQWALGLRDGSTLPEKVVGITFDDGHDADWYENALPSPPHCALPGFKKILTDFKNAHSLPWYSPHAATFVLASPVVRLALDNVSFPAAGNQSFNDSWWAAANASGVMEVHNHSSDHEFGVVTTQTWDPDLQMYVTAGGYGGDADGLAGQSVWMGTGNFSRIDTYDEANAAIAKAATYISSLVSSWPDLFAYPFGQTSSYLTDTYFPTYGASHQTLAAFCIDGGTLATSYVTRSSPRWCLPRFSYGGTYWGAAGSGVTPILESAP